MKPVSMKFARVFALAEDAPALALALARFGEFGPEPADSADMPETPGAQYRDLYLAARARLEKIESVCTPIEPLPPFKPEPLGEQQLERINDWLAEVWTQCFECQEALRRSDEEHKHVAELTQLLDRLERLDLDIGKLLSANRFIEVRVGSFPAANAGHLSDALSIAGAMLTVFGESGSEAHAVAAGPRGRQAEMAAVLRAAGWRDVDIPEELRAHPLEARAALALSVERTERESSAQCLIRDELTRNFRRRLAVSKASLECARPLAMLAAGAAAGRGRLMQVGGWMPARAVPELATALAEALPERHVLNVRDPRLDERRQVPSYTPHLRWLRPFATLVGSYGLPRYGEVDPTVLFALSFVLMFGMMFGDIGHGAVIALAGLVFRRRLGNFVPFVVACGLSSSAFGWAYGSIFGFEEVIHPLWMSPLANPNRMLLLALYWGIGFILLATALNVVNHLAERRTAEALMSGKGLAGGLFYLGALFSVARALGDRSVGIAGWLMMLLPLLAIAIHEWKETDAPRTERAVITGIGLIETAMAFGANTLSFLRVAAFALNHVALSLAVLTIAHSLDTAGHWIAVVVGNIIIMVLEGGIVAIQTIRLEYYEGFSRYFSGEGRPFKPLRFRRDFA